MKKIKIVIVLFTLSFYSFVLTPVVSQKDFLGKWRVENFQLKEKLVREGEEVEDDIQKYIEKTSYKSVKIKKESIYFYGVNNKVKDVINYEVSEIKILSDTIFIKDKITENKQVKLIQIEKGKKILMEGKFFLMELLK